MLICELCGKVVYYAGSTLRVCSSCIKTRWDMAEPIIKEVHIKSRHRFELPQYPPVNSNGKKCRICIIGCKMDEREEGFCGIRKGSSSSFKTDGNSMGKFSAYLDPLPTNCVADWVCAGGTGSGYPAFAYERGPEVGYYNLAVFFEACNLNCLFCQNWSFKLSHKRDNWEPVSALTSRMTPRVSCVCFFGGDPTPQLPFAIRATKKLLSDKPGKILRVCWETNGMATRKWLNYMLKLSYETGGCVKVDLKAWNSNIHKALCGTGNAEILENFYNIAQKASYRRHPPLVIASTLLVPEYVDETEVYEIARFIASIDKSIPYTLLAFAPQFEMRDFPTTSLEHAEACMEAARKAGLEKVRIANRHLLC